MDFKGLSDTLDTKELERYFEQFLEIYESKPKNQTALKALYELAYRQWDTYEPLSKNLAEKLTVYLMSAIQFNSFDMMDVILSIVENLSLKSVFDYIIQNKHTVQNTAVRALIDEAENDYSDIIENPFESIENY